MPASRTAGGADPSGGQRQSLALELLTKEWLAHGSSSLLSDLEALNTQPAANIGIPRAIGPCSTVRSTGSTLPRGPPSTSPAVLGRRLGDLSLYEVVDLSAAAGGEALSRLKEEGFLREVHGGLEFRNELIRAQAYYAVTGPARHLLHRRVGEVLVTRSAEDGPPASLEVAWHFLRGEDPSQAVVSVVEGAQAAIDVGAPSEAEQVLTVILRERCAENSLQRLRLLLAKALVHSPRLNPADTVLSVPVG